MRSISLTHTGHYRLADGSLIRLDRELGRWVGTEFGPDLTVRRQVVGTQDRVVDEVARWTCAAPRQLPVIDSARGCLDD
jgi:hypothetical protein